MEAKTRSSKQRNNTEAETTQMDHIRVRTSQREANDCETQLAEPHTARGARIAATSATSGGKPCAATQHGESAWSSTTVKSTGTSMFL